MEVGLFSLLALLVAMGSLVMLVVALVDLVKHPAEEWANSGSNQLVWALIVVFVGFFGPLLYLTIGRASLKAASERYQSFETAL